MHKENTDQGKKKLSGDWGKDEADKGVAVPEKNAI